MNTTQQHLLISDIKDDIIILKNGGGALILQVSAVNFGLLSEREQIAIIAAFAQMLNSLSFSIQIVIYSERLNINSYLTLLDQAQKAQVNPLLGQMMANYRQFIQTTIKENDVLDKKFYVIIPLFPLELGLTTSKLSLEQKIKTVLLPRQDQIIRQLSRLGLKATRLTSQKLIEVFYDIYNGQPSTVLAKEIELNLKQPQLTKNLPTFNAPSQSAPIESGPVNTPGLTQGSKNHPFVVEELNESI